MIAVGIVIAHDAFHGDVVPFIAIGAPGEAHITEKVALGVSVAGSTILRLALATTATDVAEVA